MVCDKVVWKDGVWQSCAWKMVCDKVVCERLCERWCVSLLIPLQTVLLRTPTDAARRWASDPYSFQHACLYVLQFLHAFPGFPSCNFLISPTFSSISLVFPSGFSKLAIHVFSSLRVFFSQFSPIFLHFPLVFNALPSFSLVFSYLLPTVFKGPRGDRNPPSPNCLVAHAPPPKKLHFLTLITTLYRDFGSTGQRPPPHTPYTHFVRENNFA